jgi:hypothetical protein
MFANTSEQCSSMFADVRLFGKIFPRSFLHPLRQAGDSLRLSLGSQGAARRQIGGRSVPERALKLLSAPASRLV